VLQSTDPNLVDAAVDTGVFYIVDSEMLWLRIATSMETLRVRSSTTRPRLSTDSGSRTALAPAFLQPASLTFRWLMR